MTPKQTQGTDAGGVARKFVLPTKPLTIIDAINRRALATGSVCNAQIGSGADFNGQNVEVRWNEHRGYWIADYIWSGPMNVARGELAHCLQAAKRFYEGQGRGASVYVKVESDADAAICLDHGFIPAETEDQSWRDWKFDEINHAMTMERYGFGSYTAHLIAATSEADYRSRGEAGHRTSPIAAISRATSPHPPSITE